MYSVFIDAGGDATIFASNTILRSGAVNPVQAVVTGNMLRISGLFPHQTYTITLTDARGRISNMRKPAGHDGSAFVSTRDKPRGVYIVDVCSTGKTHRRSLITVLP